MSYLFSHIRWLLGWAGYLLLVATGCQTQPQYVVRTLDVQHQGWDTLTVDVDFGQRKMLSGTQTVDPKTITVHLFNAAYDTLATDTNFVLPLNDKALGDKERLMVEVCGSFTETRLCEQAAVTASPKRFRIEHDLEFPKDLAYERGTYDLRFVVERQVFADTTWERLGPRDGVEGYFLAYVGDQQNEAVKVPFSRGSGRFDMAQLDHFDDFKYYLRWRLREKREAQVHFDVYAGFEGQPTFRLASIEKEVRMKTREERERDVRFFAEQAAEEVFDRLGLDEVDIGARAYIDDWTINELTYTYTIRLEINWHTGGLFFGREYELEGVLEILEDGSDARFQFNRANNAAEHRWRDHVGVGDLALGSLALYEEPDGVVLTDAGTASESEGVDQ